MSPGAKLDYHTHECAESVTLLSGALEFEVEGRRYALTALDNITIPRGLAHAALNPSATDRCELHVALASDTPGRTLVESNFSQRVLPDDSTGMPGAERVTRYRTAPRFDLGTGTSFIDFFNADLMPGLEMSGGYGLFQPGGRLRPMCMTSTSRFVSLMARRCALSRDNAMNWPIALRPMCRAGGFTTLSTRGFADGHDLGLRRSAARADRRGRSLLHPRGKSVEVKSDGPQSGGSGRNLLSPGPADFFQAKSDGVAEPKYRDMGRSVLAEQAHIEDRVMSETRSPIGADQLAGVKRPSFSRLA